MLKRLKSVSMLLFLMGASTGAAYAGRQSRRYRCENHTTKWYMYRSCSRDATGELSLVHL